MIMKRILLFVVLSIISSCTIDNPDPENWMDLVEKTYIVQFNDDSKAYLDGNMRVVWELNEEISVYDPVLKSGQTFKVTEVKDGKAKITGKISEGDFAFSAVYPASSVKQWKGIDDCTLIVPRSQSFKGSEKLDSKALVSKAYSESQSGLIVFRNQTSLLKFSVKGTEFSSVKIALSTKDSKTEEYFLSGPFVDDNEYYTSVEPGNYDGGVIVTCSTQWGINHTKSSSNTLKAEMNGYLDLGIVSDGKESISYTLSGPFEINGASEFISKFVDTEDIPSGVMTIVNPLIKNYLPYSSETLLEYKYNYVSPDINGKPTTHSAVLYVLKKALTDKREVVGTVLGHHVSATHKDECPSIASAYEAAFGFRNYAVIEADGLGFGSSGSYPQAFLFPDIAARNSIDAYKAGLQILADLNVKLGSINYNVGYSQGGFDAIAVEKYISENSGCGISFTKTFAGGSPFDVSLTFDKYMEGYSTEVAPLFLVSLVSIVECGCPSLNYSNIFQEPLLSNYQDWILSKNYSISGIKRKAGTDASTMVTSSFYNKTSSEYSSVKDVCKQNSLCSGWKPVSGSKIYIYHYPSDDMVPPENFDNMKKAFGSTSGMTFNNKDKDGLVSSFNSLKTIMEAYDVTPHAIGLVYFALVIVLDNIK